MNLNNRRVLIVDDDLLFASSLARNFRSCGCSTHVAANTEQAVAALAEPFDFVFLDVNLSGCGAEPVLSAAMDKLPAPITVAMSGGATRTQVARLFSLGAHHYLEKPVGKNDLDSILGGTLAPAAVQKSTVAALVGNLGLNDVLGQTRDILMTQALAKTGGSIKAAGRLLGISRQAVQFWKKDQ